MAISRSVHIHVTDHTYRPIEGALVSAGDASAYTDQKGRARLEIPGGVEIKVEAHGYEGQARFVEREGSLAHAAFHARPRRHALLLSREGESPVRTASRDDRRTCQGRRTRGTRRRARKGATSPMPPSASAATIIRSDKNFARSGIVVLRLDDGDDEALANRLRELTDDPSVEAAGAVVRLSEDHASFLTNLVIARFEENVNDSSVAAIAGRHGLTPEGRFKALGNVHRLRFAGPATYAVIDAANALAEEPEVIYAEPNLAATSEEDAIIPTDFLFPEQWDHQLINTPDAWQALHDMDAARTFGDADLVVAVVDNGIDDTHPELSGNVSSGNAKQVALFDFANMVGNMSNLSRLRPARPRNGLRERGSRPTPTMPPSWPAPARALRGLRAIAVSSVSCAAVPRRATPKCTSGRPDSTPAARPRAFPPSWRAAPTSSPTASASASTTQSRG